MTRLIDADAVYKILESCEIRKATIGNPLTDWEYGYTCGIERAESEIECAPTVDAEPVRHGKWIDGGSFKYKHGGRNSEAKELFGTEWRTMRRIKCSLCNKITLVDDTIPYEYCPHCGARMDG